ncbi:MAG: hypothetical protein ACLU3I_13510 [Acutalibacteraceae bacterium]
MAVGVGDDDLAALVDTVNAGVIAALVFGDGVFPDDVAFADTQSLGGFLDALDMGVGVAFVFVADQNDADLDVGADSVAGGPSGFFLGRSVGLFRRLSGLFVVGLSRAGASVFSSVLAVEAQATRAKTMTTARSRAMIFFMYSFLLKIFAVNATILLYGIMHSKSG